MPVTQIAQRIITFRHDAEPTFPANAKVLARLGPPELFGAAPLSGKLRIAAPDTQSPTLQLDLLHGGLARGGGARLPARGLESNLLGWPFFLNGSDAVVRATVHDTEEFERCIRVVADYLPAFLSAALEAPVEVAHLGGQLGDLPFEACAVGRFDLGMVAYAPNWMLRG